MNSLGSEKAFDVPINVTSERVWLLRPIVAQELDLPVIIVPHIDIDAQLPSLWDIPKIAAESCCLVNNVRPINDVPAASVVDVLRVTGSVVDTPLPAATVSAVAVSICICDALLVRVFGYEPATDLPRAAVTTTIRDAGDDLDLDEPLASVMASMTTLCLKVFLGVSASAP